jgi:predicted aldo/keto reductase-like oxidoreductase
MIDRRKFLGLGTAAAAGLYGLNAFADRPNDVADGAPRIRRYVTLGKTGLTVSDISFGSASSSDADLVRHALDRGVTYFDTAESYRFGSAEEAIGEGLRGVRDKVVLGSKTKAGAGDTRQEMMEALEGSLRRLKTDYLDIYFNHAVNDVDRMRNAEWAEFTERAKQQGKIRFRGMSGHGSRLVECLDYAIDHDLVDVVLVAYNFGQDPDFYSRLRDTINFPAIQPDLPRVLDKAKGKDIGVIAMKTLMGARLNDMRPYEWEGATFAQAAFRWVLSSPRVDALVISMTGKAEIDEYVAASGDDQVRGEDFNLLARYAYLQNTNYCRHGCNGCEGACPDGVEIAEVLRTRMYDVDYADRTLAKADYARLGDGASACLTCTHQACRNACPFGLPIPNLTRDAATRLG